MIRLVTAPVQLVRRQLIGHRIETVQQHVMVVKTLSADDHYLSDWPSCARAKSTCPNK